MYTETERTIDEMFISTMAHYGGAYDRNQWKALLRRRVIEAIEHHFKTGLEFSDIGAVMPPETMIDLIANYNNTGYQVTQTDPPDDDEFLEDIPFPHEAPDGVFNFATEKAAQHIQELHSRAGLKSVRVRNTEQLAALLTASKEEQTAFINANSEDVPF